MSKIKKVREYLSQGYSPAETGMALNMGLEDIQEIQLQAKVIELVESELVAKNAEIKGLFSALKNLSDALEKSCHHYPSTELREAHSWAKFKVTQAEVAEILNK